MGNVVRLENGQWRDTSCFRQEAIFFEQHKKYTFLKNDEYTGNAYRAFWKGIKEKRLKGMEVDGIRITGYHYSYLNFKKIMAVPTKISERNVSVRKVNRFPSWWDYDYDFFWYLELAKNGLFSDDAVASTIEEKDYFWSLKEEDDKERYCLEIFNRLKLSYKIEAKYLYNGGKDACVGKSRRRGYSEKIASIIETTYSLYANTLSLISVYNENDGLNLFSKFKGALDLCSLTEFSQKRDYINLASQGWFKASFDPTNKREVEEGSMSEVMTIGYMNKESKAAGRDIYLNLYEEAGKNPIIQNMLASNKAAESAGETSTGMSIIFGTFNDISKLSAQFLDIFYNPLNHNILPIINEYENPDHVTINKYCGFFHSSIYNMDGFGFMDEYGNSLKDKALSYRLRVRKEHLDRNNMKGYFADLREHTVYPYEVVDNISTSIFSQFITRCRRRLSYMRENNTAFKNMNCVDLHLNRAKMEVTIESIPSYKASPIFKYDTKDLVNLDSNVIIWEFPEDNIIDDSYIIVYDSVKQDDWVGDTPSLNAIYVWKKFASIYSTNNIIVAQYVGRTNDTDMANEIALKLAILYKCKIMFESEVAHVKDYFVKRNSYSRYLALQPDTALKRIYKGDYKVRRTWGCPMSNSEIKDAGVKYLIKLLGTLRVESNSEESSDLLNIDVIPDPALLEEIIIWDGKVNTDRVSAMIILALSLFNEEKDGVSKDYSLTKKDVRVEKILEYKKKYFNSN